MFLAKPFFHWCSLFCTQIFIKGYESNKCINSSWFFTILYFLCFSQQDLILNLLKHVSIGDPTSMSSQILLDLHLFYLKYFGYIIYLHLTVQLMEEVCQWMYQLWKNHWYVMHGFVGLVEFHSETCTNLPRMLRGSKIEINECSTSKVRFLLWIIELILVDHEYAEAEDVGFKLWAGISCSNKNLNKRLGLYAIELSL